MMVQFIRYDDRAFVFLGYNIWVLVGRGFFQDVRQASGKTSFDGQARAIQGPFASSPRRPQAL
jgi:hypothetical protein